MVIAARVIRDLIMLLKSAGQAADHIGHPLRVRESAMSATAPNTIDATTAGRVQAAIDGSRDRMESRQHRVEAASALLTTVAAAALALLTDADRALSLPL